MFWQIKLNAESLHFAPAADSVTGGLTHFERGLRSLSRVRPTISYSDEASP